MKISLSWITGVAALLNAAPIPTAFLLAYLTFTVWLGFWLLTQPAYGN